MLIRVFVVLLCVYYCCCRLCSVSFCFICCVVVLLLFLIPCLLFCDVCIVSVGVFAYVIPDVFLLWCYVFFFV